MNCSCKATDDKHPSVEGAQSQLLCSLFSVYFPRPRIVFTDSAKSMVESRKEGWEEEEAEAFCKTCKELRTSPEKA